MWETAILQILVCIGCLGIHWIHDHRIGFKKSFEYLNKFGWKPFYMNWNTYRRLQFQNKYLGRFSLQSKYFYFYNNWNISAYTYFFHILSIEIREEKMKKNKNKNAYSVQHVGDTHCFLKFICLSLNETCRLLFTIFSDLKQLYKGCR
jgi:hypothetical protein